MATTHLISVEEYLHSTFEPDAEYRGLFARANQNNVSMEHPKITGEKIIIMKMWLIWQ